MKESEPTTFALAMDFNKTQVAQYFYVHVDTPKRHSVSPTGICNEDMSPIYTPISNHERYLLKVKKSIFSFLISAERGENVTMVRCMNPTEHYDLQLSVHHSRTGKIS
jgi:hypothetical protein